MPRISILDSILKRPSQSYAASDSDRYPDYQRRGPNSKWSAPSDLPSAPAAPSSILSGSMFRKDTSRKYSGRDSNAGRSNAGSVAGGSISSRFRSRKAGSKMPGSYTFDQDNGGSHYAPSSVADSSATFSRKKGRWWEAGSMNFGKRNRASSVAGDSIFSEPEWNTGMNTWSGMAGIGSGVGVGQKHRGARSDIGGSYSRSSIVPPMPKLDSRITSGAPAGRLQSNVAPLGSTTLNPSLSSKPSKSRMSTLSQSNLKKGQSIDRSFSPPPRAQSPTFSDSSHSRRTAQRGSQDWNQFVQSMKGSEVSKVWEGGSGDVSNVAAALKKGPVNGVERRKSNMARLQKELQHEAQFEQVIRDPGVVHQDLLARAASQVVGHPPGFKHNAIDSLGTNVRPGSIISPPQQNGARNVPTPERALSPITSPKLRNGNLPSIPNVNVQAAESVSSEEENSSEGDSEESRYLEALREEEEETSSAGHEMRRHPLAIASTGGAAVVGAAKYRAFEAALNTNRSSVGHGSGSGAVSPTSVTMSPPTALTTVASTAKEDLPPAIVGSQPYVTNSTSVNSNLTETTHRSEEVETSSEVEDESKVPSVDTLMSDRRADLKDEVISSVNVVSDGRLGSSDKVESDERLGSSDVVESDERLGPSEIMKSDERLDPNDKSDTRSMRSTQTGKATVTFDPHSKDAQSKGDGDSIDSGDTATKGRSASIRSGSRPPTLSRRLSDISVGTSFGMSGIIRGQASSSRRFKMRDGDSDSAHSGSDDETDADFKAKIKAEQERLRNMKVGEDFFGGSLSSILDKFGKTGWDDEPSNAVSQLDLNVGPFSKSTKRDTAALSTQEILNNNAQERIMEVRRLRGELGTGTKSKRRENSDAMTVQSGIAPSFAAVWLLNQADAPVVAAAAAVSATPPVVPANAPSATSSPVTRKGHGRELSTASSDGLASSAHGSTSARIRSFFGVSAPVEAEKKKESVMDRPRNRAAKPKVMGGVPISQGRLAAEEKPEPAKVTEDVRSTFPELANSQTLSQMKEAQEKLKSPVLPPPSLPTSPEMKPSNLPSSKDKPAPVKSALKGRKESKSLADTLFSFSTSSNEKKKRRNSVAEKKASLLHDSPASPSSSSKVASKEVKTVTAEKDLANDDVRSEEKASLADVTPQMTRFHTARENLNEGREGALDEKPASVPLSEPRLSSEDGEELPSQSDVRERQVEEASSAHHEVEEIPTQEQPRQLSDFQRDQGEQNNPSELWSGESGNSSDPATSGASEILDSMTLPGVKNGENSMNGLATEKKLPMPPTPTFEDSVLPTSTMGREAPSFESSRSGAMYYDDNRTPLAEVEQPSFGINLIPPTPPALETSHSYTNITSKAPRGAAPATVMEQPGEDGFNEAMAMQRSNSRQRSINGRSDSSDPVRRSSSKKGSSSSHRSNVGGDYQGQGINLPNGLSVTTVASSVQRRQSIDSQPRSSATATSDPSTDGTIQKKKSKGKRSSNTPSRVYASPSYNTSDPSIRKSSSALNHSLAGAPPVPLLPGSLPHLAIPSNRSETNSSVGSDSIRSRSHASTSPSPSPAPSASGRSGMSSSNISSSALSDTSNGKVNYNRKIRTLSAGPTGQARTSLMSSISEWESSPIDSRARSVSPLPSYVDSPVAMNRASRGQGGFQRDHSASPSPIRQSPSGTPPDTQLNSVFAPRALSSRAESLDGHGVQAWGGTYLGAESDISGLNGTQSVLSLPSIPQSSYRPQDPVKASNTIDDRLYAKTTMSTIAVTSGAFRSKSLRKRRSSAEVSSASLYDSARQSRVSVDTVPDGLTEELSRTTMSMTAHTPPPRKLNSTQLLVQIITCAIDETDRILLRERIRTENAYGFVPGRSFCGRVMETGWEVKRMRKGDVVFGLQHSRKCGALAEFMTIDQNLVAKAPQDCLTTEEIAALPSVGILAHQMTTSHCSQLKRGSRILILNAHDGVGLLTMQESANMGLIIVAHCPASISDGVALCEANGASEVVIGDALWALNSLHESSFDLVIDTAGGRRIYDAARRIIAFEGQFVTCVGDSQSISANPNLKSHLRSLRRSFFKKDTKRIGYEWVGTDTGEDCREGLEAVKVAAERGQICPRLQSILSFGEAPRAFETALRGGEVEPGSIVVRIS
ncbi:hypothetical protein CBS101457_000930 [Exobasidium rhododendri]|nr:hypothetical protein CBS101457_000930 [Exobasidium rhododendri]